MGKADETIKDVVRHTRGILAEHSQPGNRDCEETVNKVAEILDGPEVEKALKESDFARNDARQAAASQSGHPGDYRPQIARVPTKQK